MKRFIDTVLLLLVTFAAVSCHKPRVIPDDKLAMIFHDVYLTNAYVQRDEMNLDSIKLYEPIFEKYGYDTEDLHTTISSFAKRKSARLSDVVEQAIKMLEAESDRLNAAVADLDTIDNIARRTFARVVYSDSIIRMRRRADTVRMRRTLPIDRAGDYLVEYHYNIDSSDRNTNHRAVGYMLNAEGKRSGHYSFRYRRLSRDMYRHTFTADSTIRELVLDLCVLGAGSQKPNFTIDSMTITFFMPKEEARDSLTVHDFGFRLLKEGFYTPEQPADSAAYFAEPPRIR